MNRPPADLSFLPALADELALIAAHANEAGDLAMRHFRGGDLDIRLKDGESPVTRVDYAIDDMLRDGLSAARPTYGWLSEETPDTQVERRLSAPRTFIVDPLDGTRAFIKGLEIWCVSIGLVEDGRPVAGVLACPALGETITATRGGGAFCNGEAIRVATPRNEPLVGGPRPLIDRLNAAGNLVAHRHTHVPSLAYRLTMVARSAMDATFVKPSAADWDIAAAGLILEEAGAAFTDARGRAVMMNRADPLKGTLIACHPSLETAMLGVVAAPSFG